MDTIKKNLEIFILIIPDPPNPYRNMNHLIKLLRQFIARKEIAGMCRLLFEYFPDTRSTHFGKKKYTNNKSTIYSMIPAFSDFSSNTSSGNKMSLGL